MSERNQADDVTASEAEPAGEKSTFIDKMLDGIERVGNKVPHPAIIFLSLIVAVIALSAILSLLNISVKQEIAEYEPIEAQVTYVGGSIEPVEDVDPAELFEEGKTEIREETLGIKSLLTVDGIRFIFTSFVQNFADFSVVAVILVAMIGVGVAEKAGMMAALIRKLVQIAPRRAITFIITLVFLIAGLCFGIGARTLKSSNDVIDAITGTFSTLAALLFLLLLISQFIALFNYTNMPQVAAIASGEVLESANIGAVPLLIGFIIVIAVIDIIIPGVAPKWAIFAPIFIPLFLQLGVAPQTVTAAYRVGDGPMNVITPLMVYLPFIVVVAQQYRKDAGVGTIVSLMLPYTVIVLVAWTLFFALWFVLGIPLGPGFGVGI